MLRENIARLDAVLFTHAHRDHTSGLDDVRAYNYLQQMAMPLYGRKAVLDQLRVEFAYAFQGPAYPGLPQLVLQEIDESPFTVNGIAITPLPVMHLRMPVLGFRIGNFSYITDANFISPETLALLQGTEILVLNALQREAHISHFSLSEALQIAATVNARKTYLTHISHKLGLHSVVSRELPENIELAFDGLQITV